MYRLKKDVESFQVVDGPFAGRKFRHGVAYPEIPDAEAARFDKIEPANRGQGETAKSRDGETAKKARKEKSVPDAGSDPE